MTNEWNLGPANIQFSQENGELAGERLAQV